MYAYDASGRRATATTSITVSGNLVPQLELVSIYDTGGRLVYETSTVDPIPDRIFASGFEPAVAATTATDYFYLDNHAVAKNSKNGTTNTLVYLHTDPLGSPVAQTNPSGTVVGTTTYLPYGGRYATTGTGNDTGVGFASHYQDGSDFIYMKARYYDPQLHRFVSGDPNGVDDGTALNFNRYSYADNSPYAKYDPSGRQVFGSANIQPWNPEQDRANLQVLPTVAVAGVLGLATFETGGLLGPIASDVLAYGWVNGILLNPYADTMGGAIALDATVQISSGSVSPTSIASEFTLADDALVCRGGLCTADRFVSGTGVSVDANGLLQNVSVTSANGASAAELSAGFRQGQVGVSTVGDIRDAGGNVYLDPTPNNPYHCVMCDVTLEDAQDLFTPTVPNPSFDDPDD